MKIKKENMFGLNFTQNIKDTLYNIHNTNYFSKYDSELVKPFQEQWKWLLSDSENKNLFFTETAKKIANAIHIGKFNPNILKLEKPKKFTYLIDENTFYRVAINEKEILVIRVFRDSISVNYDSFKIIPKINQVIYPKNNDYMNDKNFVEFLRLLIFTEFSDITEKVLKPKQSIGTKKDGKYLNESGSNVIIVDSTWNIQIIKNEAFGVNGHFRLQPIGKDRLDRKLIYIKEYIKDGYVRKSKKQ